MALKDTLLMFKGSFPMKANLAQREPGYVKRWEHDGIYGRMRAKNAGQPAFYLHDGPPYANGDIHCGHALNKIIKDTINRYKSLRGYQVTYIPGWDTHGLPIENAVAGSGVDRKNMPVSEFRKACMKYAYKQVEHQMKSFKRLGVLGDFDHAYLTLTKDYEAKEISVFAQMALKGYIYKGLKPVAWSPNLECALAEAEIEYHDVKAETVYVRFQVKDGKGLLAPNDYFVIWTTTPWTIPADTAVCLNPKMAYGLFRTDRGNLVFLLDLKEKVAKDLGLRECVLIKEFKGAEAEGLTVFHPLYKDRESLVILGDHVTAESGTGCVHTAGGHGLDDYKVCLKYGIPPFCPVDGQGKMTSEAGDRLKGLYYADANSEVIKMLEESGLLLAEKEIVHAYPHDWRTHSPVIFRATPQWFCSISSFRESILREIDSDIKFKPAWGKIRLRKMVEGREDWCISRQRAWGVPIPIIYNEDGSPIVEKAVFDRIISLVAEFGSNVWFEREAKDLLPDGYENKASPHGIFTKEKDIMDVWFDSGSSWLGVELARGIKYPADLIFEGTDQYRGWYNSSLTLAVAAGYRTPYKAILTHGFIVDQNGDKFSKSKGNGISPSAIYDVYGADIMRLWACSIDFTMAEIKLSAELIETVAESYRKIRNTFKFMLSNIYDAPDVFYDKSKPYSYSPFDRMIIAKLSQVTELAAKAYDRYDLLGVTSLLENFMINDLSAFYLDAAKDTLYCEKADSVRRKGVQHVLSRLIGDLSAVWSPILPFTMEEVNDTLPDGVPISIALAAYPSTSPDSEDLADYEVLTQVRQKTFRAVEQARAAKTVESSAAAEVSYLTSDERELKVLDSLGGELVGRIFLLAGFSFRQADNDDIDVVRTCRKRCDRCWNYFDELKETEDGSHVCDRCREALGYDRQ